MWTAQFYPIQRPRQLLTSGSLGTMGFGLPTALGAAMANPGSRVLCFTGDGSIMMNIQELATMADNNIDVKIVLLHNSVLGMVYQWQKLFYGHRFSNTIMDTKVDFVKLAEAMGIKGVRIQGLEGFEANLKAALEGEGATLIDVILPPNEDVLPMVAPGAQLDNMVLGD